MPIEKRGKFLILGMMPQSKVSFIVRCITQQKGEIALMKLRLHLIAGLLLLALAISSRGPANIQAAPQNQTTPPGDQSYLPVIVKPALVGRY